MALPIPFFSSSLFKPPQLQAAMVRAFSASSVGTFKDVVSECGSGPSVRPTAGLSLHDLDCSEHVSNGALVQRDCVRLLQLEDGLDDCRFRRVPTAGVDLEHATAGESTGIIGLLERSVSHSSLLNSVNSSMGVACVGLASAAVASLASVCSFPCPFVACCWCCARASHCVIHA